LLKLHSSVKPDVPRAVLTDFGIAEIIGSSAITIGGQKIANVNGLSPKYAAPEVWHRTRASESELTSESLQPGNSKKGDIYAYAIVLWEILHRKDAWTDLSNGDISKHL
jgi:serine/threonine protein kinase